MTSNSSKKEDIKLDKYKLKVPLGDFTTISLSLKPSKEGHNSWQSSRDNKEGS
jgi:hypothetical protein